MSTAAFLRALPFPLFFRSRRLHRLRHGPSILHKLCTASVSDAGLTHRHQAGTLSGPMALDGDRITLKDDS